VKSTVSKEFLLYFDSDIDIRLSLESREEFLDLIKLQFPRFAPSKHLKVFGVPEDTLKSYKSLYVSR
jgi:predicted nucleotidyltransferase